MLLDEGGKEMRSIEFADYMKRKMNTVNKLLNYYGLDVRLTINSPDN